MNMRDAGSKEALYLRWILEEIGLIMDKATPILADNQVRCKSISECTATKHQEQRDKCRNEALYYIIMDRL